MKHRNIYALILSAALLTWGCSDFLNVNTDPTRLKTAGTPLVLTSAEGSLAFHMGADLWLYSTVWSQQETGNGPLGQQSRVFDQYILTTVDVNNSWGAWYAGHLADLDYLRKQVYAEGNPQHGGIAKILQAFSYQIMVDAWGKIPYKEALKGTKNPQPKYDDTKEIYDSLFLLIDAGIVDLGKTNKLAVGSEDLIYGGNIARWIRFANTLKLRLALHYAKDDNGAKLNALLAAGGPFMTGNADNFNLVFENVTTRQNPISQFEVSRGDYMWPSNIFVNMMNAKTDPRKPFFLTPVNYPNVFPYTPTMGDTYVGQVSNAAQNVAASRMYTYIRGPVTSDTGGRTGGNLNFNSLAYAGTSPIRMLTFAEYNFIRAERELVYGGTLAQAQIYYQAAITASMADAGAAVGTYLTAAYAGFGTANIGTLSATPAIALQQIIEEKWIANFGVCMEPWTDWRRTGYPVLAPSAGAVAVGNVVIPRIVTYPQTEIQANVTNVPDRPNITTKSVFWDK